MKTSSRDVRAARKAKEEKKGYVGWSEAIEELTAEALAKDDTPFPLPSGTQVDPRAPWELPKE